MRMISVIVPVYNVKKYLDACVQSIVNQTYRDMEILLIDDGSTDDSGDLCDKWLEKDARVKVFHKENGGICSARNYGLAHCRGEYIAFVDSDDMIDVNMMQHLYEAIKKEHADVAACYECAFINENEITTYYEDNQEIKVENHEQYLWHFNEHFRGATTWVWNKLYTRECIGNLDFDEKIKKMEDIVFSSKVAVNIKKCVWLPERLYFYRQREGSIMHDVKPDLLRDYVSAIEVEFMALQGEASELFQSEHLKRCLSMLYSVSKQAKEAGLTESRQNCRRAYREMYRKNHALISFGTDAVKYFLLQNLC